MRNESKIKEKTTIDRIQICEVSVFSASPYTFMLSYQQKPDLLNNNICMSSADVTVYIDKSGSSELTEDSSSTVASQADSDHDHSDVTCRQK